MIHLLRTLNREPNITVAKTAKDIVNFIGEKEVRMEDGNVTKMYDLRQSIIDLAMVLINTCGIFGGLIYSDAYFINENSKFLPLLLNMSFACSLTLFPMSIARCLVHQEQVKWKGELSNNESLISAGYLPFQVIENVVAWVRPFTFLQGKKMEFWNVENQRFMKYEINDYLTFFSLVGFWRLITLIIAGLNYNSNRSDRICKIHGFKRELTYGMKCWFKRAPYEFIGFCMFISIPIFTYGIRICERPLAIITGNNFDLYTTALWWCVVTMTTIGYGDYYPWTIGGRFWTGLLFMWGVILVALIIVALSDSTQMNFRQARSRAMIDKVDSRQILEERASFLIVTFWKMYKAWQAYSQRHTHEKPTQKTKIMYIWAQKRWRDTFFEFRLYKSKFNRIDTEFDISEYMVINNDYLNVELEEAMQGQLKIIDDLKIMLGIIKKRKQGGSNRLIKQNWKFQAILR